jgi:hypothetical protein
MRSELSPSKHAPDGKKKRFRTVLIPSHRELHTQRKKRSSKNLVIDGTALDEGSKAADELC